MHAQISTFNLSSSLSLSTHAHTLSLFSSTYVIKIDVVVSDRQHPTVLDSLRHIQHLWKEIAQSGRHTPQPLNQNPISRSSLQ